MSFNRISLVEELEESGEIKGCRITRSKDGIYRILAGDSHGRVSLWDINRNLPNLETNHIGTYEIHDCEATSLYTIEPCKIYPKGAIITGYRDGQVYVWIHDRTYGVQIIHVLLYHKETVTSIVASDDGVIWTASWDGYICEWIDGIMARKIDTKMAIWALCLFGNTILSGGQGSTVNHWSLRTLALQQEDKGHTDVIRQIVPVDSDYFASTSNDGHVFLWDLFGNIVKRVKVSSDYLYDLVFWPSVTSGKGSMRSVAVGENGQIAIITFEDSEVDKRYYPARSLWALDALDEFIIIGTSAKKLLLISENPLYGKNISGYLSEIPLYSISDDSMSLNTIPIYDLPKILGTNVGEKLAVINTDSTRNIYEWSGATWELIGEMISKPTEEKAIPLSTRESCLIVLNGKSYDADYDHTLCPYQNGLNFIAIHGLDLGILEALLKELRTLLKLKVSIPHFNQEIDIKYYAQMDKSKLRLRFIDLMQSPILNTKISKNSMDSLLKLIDNITTPWACKCTLDDFKTIYELQKLLITTDLQLHLIVVLDLLRLLLLIEQNVPYLEPLFDSMLRTLSQLNDRNPSEDTMRPLPTRNYIMLFICNLYKTASGRRVAYIHRVCIKNIVGKLHHSPQISKKIINAYKHNNELLRYHFTTF